MTHKPRNEPLIEIYPILLHSKPHTNLSNVLILHAFPHIYTSWSLSVVKSFPHYKQCAMRFIHKQCCPLSGLSGDELVQKIGVPLRGEEATLELSFEGEELPGPQCSGPVASSSNLLWRVPSYDFCYHWSLFVKVHSHVIFIKNKTTTTTEASFHLLQWFYKTSDFLYGYLCPRSST